MAFVMSLFGYPLSFLPRNIATEFVYPEVLESSAEMR